MANLASLPNSTPAAIIDELVEPDLPQEVRDRVESLLVDGQKVTAADIRRMKAAALASYAKQANDDESMTMATRIRDRAIRRARELLKLKAMSSLIKFTVKMPAT